MVVNAPPDIVNTVTDSLKVVEARFELSRLYPRAQM